MDNQNVMINEGIFENEKNWKPGLKLTVKKLFGEKEVNLEFDSSIKIFVGENGIGKTTLLNIIYYLLDDKYEQLSAINFESIILSDDKENIVLNRNELSTYIKLEERESNRFIRQRLKRHLSSDEYRILNKEVLRGKKSIEEYIKIIEKSLSERTRFSNNIIEDIYKIAEIMGVNNYTAENLTRIKALLNIYFKGEIMYFPTYRRIEEDLHKIGFEIKASEKRIENGQLLEENEIIKFGMDDVEKLFQEITSEITKSTTEGLKRFTGDMLSQLVSNTGEDISKEVKSIANRRQFITVVLERVKNELPAETIKNINKIILNQDLTEENVYSEFLVYFLHHLIKVYERSSKEEEAINKFAEICNKYLVDKEVEYDDGAVTIGIFREKTKEPVMLSQLSSGEKQIVSIFAKLYLTKNDHYIILFDEPELSLSIKWQKMFLIDVLNTKKCSFIFSVTHSPFIYNNSLKNYTLPLEFLFEDVLYNE